MKIRTDFVTNSSSSSYVIVTKVDKCNELIEYMREEYGKHGLRLLEEHLVKGVLEDGELAGEWVDEYIEEELEPESDYLVSRHIAWSTEGDTDGDDVWLYDHIPAKYKTDIYETDPD